MDNERHALDNTHDPKTFTGLGVTLTKDGELPEGAISFGNIEMAEILSKHIKGCVDIRRKKRKR